MVVVRWWLSIVDFPRCGWCWRDRPNSETRAHASHRCRRTSHLRVEKQQFRVVPLPFLMALGVIPMRISFGRAQVLVTSSVNHSMKGALQQDARPTAMFVSLPCFGRRPVRNSDSTRQPHSIFVTAGHTKINAWSLGVQHIKHSYIGSLHLLQRYSDLRKHSFRSEHHCGDPFLVFIRCVAQGIILQNTHYLKTITPIWVRDRIKSKLYLK